MDGGERWGALVLLVVWVHLLVFVSSDLSFLICVCWFASLSGGMHLKQVEHHDGKKDRLGIDIDGHDMTYEYKMKRPNTPLGMKSVLISNAA